MPTMQNAPLLAKLMMALSQGYTEGYAPTQQYNQEQKRRSLADVFQRQQAEQQQQNWQAGFGEQKRHGLEVERAANQGNINALFMRMFPNGGAMSDQAFQSQEAEKAFGRQKELRQLDIEAGKYQSKTPQITLNQALGQARGVMDDRAAAIAPDIGWMKEFANPIAPDSVSAKYPLNRQQGSDSLKVLMALLTKYRDPMAIRSLADSLSGSAYAPDTTNIDVSKLSDEELRKLAGY